MRHPTVRALLVVCVAVTLGAGAAHSKTWHLDPVGTGDVLTIQAGIDSAAPGDTVLIAPGWYGGLGNLVVDFKGKAVVVTSEGGAEATILEYFGSWSGFCFQSGEGPSSVLSGLTLRRPAGSQGAGVFCSGSSPTIENNIFIENQVTQDGGAILCLNASPTIRGNSFESCSAGQTGGAICAQNSSTPLIQDNRFAGCSAAAGGAIYLENGSSATIRGNSIVGGTATGGGGIFCHTFSDALIANNTICGNTASNGGGIFSNFSAPIILNNTLDANGASNGGGIIFQGAVGTPVVENTIVTSSVTGEGIASAGGATPRVSFCDIYGNAGGDTLVGIAGEGNFSADPLFCGLAGPGAVADYRLEPGSPCAPMNNPTGLLIGSFPVGCSSTGIRELPRESWGRIKERYRGD